MLLTGLLVEYIVVKKGATWDLELKPEFLSQANTFVTAILHELFWLFYCVQWSYRFNIFPKQCHRDKTYSWDGFFGLRLVLCFFGFVCCFLGFFLRLANVNSAVLFISCSLNQVRMKVVSWFLNNISVMANQWIIESKYSFHLLLLNTYAAVSPSLPSHESFPLHPMWETWDIPAPGLPVPTTSSSGLRPREGRIAQPALRAGEALTCLPHPLLLSRSLSCDGSFCFSYLNFQGDHFVVSEFLG